MKRLYSDVCSLQGTLQQRPEVVDALRVHLTAHVLAGMGYYFMRELFLQAVISDEIISVDAGSTSYLLQYFVLQCLALYIGNDPSAYLPQIAVKHSENYRL